MSKKPLLLIAASLVTTQAMADDYRPYFGGGIGNTSMDDSGWIDKVAEYGNNSNKKGAGFKSDDLSFRGFAGYHQNRIVGLELAYTKYGKSKAEYKGQDLNYSWAPTSISLSANLGFSSQNGLRPFVLIGSSYVNINQEGRKELTIANGDSGAFGLHYGVGLEYTPQVDRGLSYRLAYEGDMVEVTSSTNTSHGIAIGSLYAGVLFKL
ncbi:hypothetical protein CS022_05785 [Veronia nyctiphanis]|uniref:Outer membrane protein beta-barrel domain-containing protein n=1 Tax=Veronia nyctiphanis TaxID=1278244 RepID=A0A4Q0YSB7_9GAMM|nr:outer membrane beta-barrel protein [Veronia nyctiphanis]RXJ74127.1 hypothetical protein CS022_05785 [Veronia nyctiphanis]